MMAPVQRDSRGDSNGHAEAKGCAHRFPILLVGVPIRVVAPGVCYILLKPADVARVVAARPGAHVAPLVPRTM